MGWVWHVWGAHVAYRATGSKSVSGERTYRWMFERQMRYELRILLPQRTKGPASWQRGSVNSDRGERPWGKYPRANNKEHSHHR